MEVQKKNAIEMFRKKFETFKDLTDATGEDTAWEKMLEGYPERQKERMGPSIKNTTLAVGFTQVIPIFKQMGMEMDVFDISNQGVDAALEVHRICPVMSIYKEYGLSKPCRVICEMDIEATRRAFPAMRVDVLSRQADGACVCIFKYEREVQE